MSTFARKRISHDQDLPGAQSRGEILALLPWLWRLGGVTWSVLEAANLSTAPVLLSRIWRRGRVFKAAAQLNWVQLYAVGPRLLSACCIRRAPIDRYPSARYPLA
jgi:hypothetical protein